MCFYFLVGRNPKAGAAAAATAAATAAHCLLASGRGRTSRVIAIVVKQVKLGVFEKVQVNDRDYFCGRCWTSTSRNFNRDLDEPAAKRKEASAVACAHSDVVGPVPRLPVKCGDAHPAGGHVSDLERRRAVVGIPQPIFAALQAPAPCRFSDNADLHLFFWRVGVCKVTRTDGLTDGLALFVVGWQRRRRRYGFIIVARLVVRNVIFFFVFSNNGAERQQQEPAVLGVVGGN